jgi:Dolichyl-phosphate-mannose-protein mannosyltransferase
MAERRELPEWMLSPRLPWALAAVFLLIRLPLINWYIGEYTDSVILLTLFENDNTYYPPFFTIVSQFFHLFGLDLTLSGRLVSIIAIALLCIPVFSIGKRLHHEGVGFVAVLLIQSAAMTNRWAPRAMSDALFVLLFMLAIDRLFAVWSENRKKSDILLLLFWSGLATQTRYQGFALLPLVIWAIARYRKPSIKIMTLTLYALPWLLLIGWIALRGFGHGMQFSDRNASMEQTLFACQVMTLGFLKYLPYAMGYINVALGLYGLVLLIYKKQSAYTWLFVYLLLLWFAAHVPFQSFQFRYFLPLLPLLVIPASRAWWDMAERLKVKWRIAVWSGLVCWLFYCICFSVIVLISQREAFGDIWKAAQYVKAMSAKNTLCSLPDYGAENRNYKLAFWSGKKVKVPKTFSLPYSDPWDASEGDVIVLSNVYTNISSLRRRIDAKWETEETIFTARLIPLMGDIMMPTKQGNLTSTPYAMAYRNQPQRFTTLVIKLKNRK